MNKDKLKLHLGCGNIRLPNFINIDFRKTDSVDLIENVATLKSFKENSVDLIYTCHVLEHFTRWDYKNVLKRWYEILKPGGTLRVALPDFEVIAEYYVETKDINTIRGTIYGHQDYEGNFHHWCWDFNTLKNELEEIGFNTIERYDFRETEHSQVKDWSWDHLPRLYEDGSIIPDEEWIKGRLISLNVQCKK